MTGFEIAVPVIALAVAGLGVLWLKKDTRRLDARIDRHHPAE